MRTNYEREMPRMQKGWEEKESFDCGTQEFLQWSLWLMVIILMLGVEKRLLKEARKYSRRLPLENLYMVVQESQPVSQRMA